MCMWCWHRIRETETGLCPACRTPYGEDPHAFSAVDVEEVVKANKEKERQQQQSSRDGGDTMEVPKDRAQLANMRVIRRNLVYAVGLPPNIANEDLLRKPEYYGQYGKISKMVLNKTNVTSTVTGRASASAYVTFVHKQDTLACILALDGFYMENRNIRASYGTSKYCSAFIKNVRCNNPECTYLHEMGELEDTFTKQEIQAGYVTSGRDVLARQQQIMAEQIRLAGTGPRKKIGGGGPSGTGRHATNPVFPPPEFDEPARPAKVVPPPPVPRGGITRASTTMLPSSSAVAAATAIPKGSMTARSASVGASSGGLSPTLSAISTQGGGVPHRKSAASIVAGSSSQRTTDTSSTSTLTPLTPLKRTKSKSFTTAAPSLPVDTNATSIGDKLVPLRNGKSKSFAVPRNTIGGDLIGGIPSSGSMSSLSELNNTSDPLGPALSNGRTSSLGGQIFTGELSGKPITSESGKDRWNSPGELGAPISERPAAIGPSGSSTSSTALASILGINLPTGSGSLQESNLWNSSHVPLGPPQPPSGPSALSSLNGLPLQQAGDAVGGIAIGGGIAGAPPPIGGGAPSNQNDVALLQSLLPGANISEGNGGSSGNTIGNWSGSGASNGYNDKNWSSGSTGNSQQQLPQRQQQPQNRHGIW